MMSQHQTVKHQNRLLYRIEQLQQNLRRSSIAERVTLDTLHHLLACDHLTESGIVHVDTIVSLMEK